MRARGRWGQACLRSAASRLCGWRQARWQHAGSGVRVQHLWLSMCRLPLSECRLRLSMCSRPAQLASGPPLLPPPPAGSMVEMSPLRRRFSQYSSALSCVTLFQANQRVGISHCST